MLGCNRMEHGSTACDGSTHVIWAIINPCNPPEQPSPTIVVHGSISMGCETLSFAVCGGQVKEVHWHHDFLCDFLIVSDSAATLALSLHCLISLGNDSCFGYVSSKKPCTASCTFCSFPSSCNHWSASLRRMQTAQSFPDPYL
jgi:hypothetical protein